MELDQPVGHDAAALSPIRQACFLSGPANPTCLGGQCHHAYPPCKCAGPGYSDALKHFASGHRLTGLPTCRADGVEVQLASRIALYDQGAARSQTAQQPFNKRERLFAVVRNWKMTAMLTWRVGFPSNLCQSLHTPWLCTRRYGGQRSVLMNRAPWVSDRSQHLACALLLLPCPPEGGHSLNRHVPLEHRVGGLGHQGGRQGFELEAVDHRGWGRCSFGLH